MNKKEVGRRIKSIRQKKNITREELAKKLDISYSSLEKHEQGLRGFKIETINKFADALGVSFAELVKEEVKEEKNKPFVPETLHKGKEYTKELYLQLIDLNIKKNKYKDIDNVLKNSPIEVIEYIDTLKEITEKTEEYYKQIEHEHTIEKKYYIENMKIVDKAKELLINIPSIDNENK